MEETVFSEKVGILAPIDWFTPQWTSTFEEIKPNLKTGDIILVHGRYPGSWIVEKLQGCKWGHVCMVVQRKDIDPEDSMGLPELLLWESNTYMEGNAPNLWPKNETYHNKVKQGPMIISLKERLEKNLLADPNIQFALKSLESPHKLDFHLLPSLFDEHITKKFPKNDWDIFASVYLGRNKNKVASDPKTIIRGTADQQKSAIVINSVSHGLMDLRGPEKEKSLKRDEIYCSELIAMTYKHLGLLTNQYVSNAYTPLDFSDKSSISLLKNAKWSSEIYFTM